MTQDKIVINESGEKQRLDVFLAKQYPDYTRSQIKNNITSGKVLVNGKVEKAGYVLRLNDNIVVELEESMPMYAEAQKLPINIVYEDDDIVVVNKAQGMVVHPAVGNKNGTLVNALLYTINELSGINGDTRPGIVHRIDKDTSGLMVVAKNDKAHLSLSEQIQSKTCKRFYKALLQGRLNDSQGEIITNIGRDAKNRLKMAVVGADKGKFAHTIFRVEKYYQGYTLVDFELKTGRTHQIRVHSAYLKHPIVGDKLYNNNPCKFKLDGQLLHAYKLVLTHPVTNQEMTFEAPLPEYFDKVLTQLKEI